MAKISPIQFFRQVKQEIKKVLGYDDLEKIVAFLSQAEKKADEKIAALQYSKSKIQLAREDYERKLRARKNRSGTFIKDIPIWWNPSVLTNPGWM